MAKKTIVNEAVGVMRTVAEAALDAAAMEARRMIAETVSNTVARAEERATKALPQIETAVKARLAKPIDRMLKTRGGRTQKAKSAAPARGKAKKAVRSAAKKAAARPSAKKASRKKAAPRSKSRKKRH
ncbi:MAG TPA: hypothetical protein VG270_11695 [Pseudolabrys sp.]|jgi:hypothetical protein|nr:hypothetical protein [Pseudolabrys sp.]